MKCKNCGSEIGEGKKFCRMCGVRVENKCEETQKPENIADNKSSNNADDKHKVDVITSNKYNSKKNKTIAAVIVVAAVALIGIGIYWSVTRNNANEVASNESGVELEESIENNEITEPESDTSKKDEEQKELVVESIEESTEKAAEVDEEQIEATEGNNTNEKSAAELTDEYRNVLGDLKSWWFNHQECKPVHTKRSDSIYVEALETLEEDYWNQINSKKFSLPKGKYSFRVEYNVTSGNYKWEIPIFIQQSDPDYLVVWKGNLSNDDMNDKILERRVLKAEFEVKEDWEDLKVAFNLGKLQDVKFHLYRVKLVCEELYDN